MIERGEQFEYVPSKYTRGHPDYVAPGGATSADPHGHEH
jgi:hypothetical protein